MNRETFRLSQKELQRVAVISSCIKGDLACARAAELLDLTPRHVQRLKARYRQGSAAALAHASRGRPSPRRLPQPVRARILDLARTRYAGFNDHHLCEKLCEVEGLPLGRETLRRLLRAHGFGSPRKRRPPLTVSAVCPALAKAKCSCWMPASIAGSKIAARNSPCSASLTTPPAKSWSPSFSPPKTPAAISACS